ncbi:hypothetical protein DIPPA_08553 [Diplonema papillatum]|nr:hypothetical protein DIPPA_08553 [Diplonema papillatum]
MAAPDALFDTPAPGNDTEAPSNITVPAANGTDLGPADFFDEDDGFEWWMIALVVGICLCLVAILVVLRLTEKKPETSEGGDPDEEGWESDSGEYLQQGGFADEPGKKNLTWRRASGTFSDRASQRGEPAPFSPLTRIPGDRTPSPPGTPVQAVRSPHIFLSSPTGMGHPMPASSLPLYNHRTPLKPSFHSARSLQGLGLPFNPSPSPYTSHPFDHILPNTARFPFPFDTELSYPFFGCSSQREREGRLPFHDFERKFAKAAYSGALFQPDLLASDVAACLHQTASRGISPAENDLLSKLNPATPYPAANVMNTAVARCLEPGGRQADTEVDALNWASTMKHCREDSPQAPHHGLRPKGWGNVKYYYRVVFVSKSLFASHAKTLRKNHVLFWPCPVVVSSTPPLRTLPDYSNAYRAWCASSGALPAGPQQRHFVKTPSKVPDPPFQHQLVFRIEKARVFAPPSLGQDFASPFPDSSSLYPSPTPSSHSAPAQTVLLPSFSSFSVRKISRVANSPFSEAAIITVVHRPAERDRVYQEFKKHRHKEASGKASFRSLTDGT